MSKHVYNIQGSVPRTETKGYASHVSARVIASDIRKVIDLVEAKYPGITIHNIQHHGFVDIEEQG